MSQGGRPGYGMTHPTGGTTKAVMVAVQASLSVGFGLPIVTICGAARPSEFAATLADPTKLTQLRMAVPGKITPPAHTGVGLVEAPGHRSPQLNGPGSITMRAI